MFTLMPVNILLAIRSLNRNRMRTVLTMLGIIIGVAAVLTMVALGTGAKASVEGEVSSAGTNMVFVKAGNYTRGGESVGIVAGSGASKTLTPADAEAIRTQVKGIAHLSPGLALRTFVVSGSNRQFMKIQGVSADFALVYGWVLSPGHMWKADAAEAVLGKEAATKLFGAGVDPIGQSVSVRDVSYVVVGVTDGLADDQKDVLFVPWQRLQQSLGAAHLETITLAAEKAGEASRIAADVAALLRKRHGIAAGPPAGYVAAQRGSGTTPDDFTVETQAAQALTKGLYTPAAAFALANLPKLDEVTLDEMADTLDRASGTMTALLASIAGVSLIVGGIGIMNIMLASVTERTREIGIRRALGAKQSDIVLQFLIETVLLAGAGGVLGVIMGLGIPLAISHFAGVTTVIKAWAPALAFSVSVFTGIAFGIYPAMRAAKMNPVEALRHE